MAIRSRTTSKGERRYQVRVFIRQDIGGKRIELAKTFRKKRDAQKWERDQKNSLDEGTFVKPSDEPFGLYLRKWMDGPKRRSIRARTWQNYDLTLRRYVLTSTLAAVPLSRLTTTVLETFYADLAENGGPTRNLGPLRAKSVRNVHTILHSALSKAVQDRRIIGNPAAGAVLPKDHVYESEQLPCENFNRIRALSAAELERLLDASAKPPPMRHGKRSGKHSRPWSWKSPRSRNRWHALWHILANGGLRPSEALALTWNDVDWNQGSVWIDKALVTGIRGKKWLIERPKTEKSIRSVSLDPETMESLREHHMQQEIDKTAAGMSYTNHGFVFAGENGNPLDLKNATKRHFKPLLEAAKIPPIRVYDLRHTHASLLLSAGLPVHLVSARLGHSSAKMTLDVYGHVLQHQQEDAVGVYRAYIKREAARSNPTS